MPDFKLPGASGPKDAATCSACGGTGTVLNVGKYGHAKIAEAVGAGGRTTCKACGGSGRVGKSPSPLRPPKLG